VARPKGDAAATAARRESILDAALQVFAVAGFNGSSLKQVAEIVGITEAGILHHFKNKGILLIEVLKRREELTRRFSGLNHNDGIAQIVEWIAVQKENSTLPGIIELFTILSAEATAANHPAHEYFQQRYSKVTSNFTGMFTNLKNSNFLATDESPEDLGASLVALSDGLQLQWLLNPAVDMPKLHIQFFSTVLNEAGWAALQARFNETK
jgi:AcrR family transcriptional regulator